MDKDAIVGYKKLRDMISKDRLSQNLQMRVPTFCKHHFSEEEQQKRAKALLFLEWLVTDRYCDPRHEGNYDGVCEILEEAVAVGMDFLESWEEGSLRDVFDYTKVSD